MFLHDLEEDDVEWVVNDNAELGVKIGDRLFFMYKGRSLEYKGGYHEDGTPMMWRRIGKREYGETCWPERFIRAGRKPNGRFTDPCDFHENLSFGPIEAGAWKPIDPKAELPADFVTVRFIDKNRKVFHVLPNGERKPAGKTE